MERLFVVRNFSETRFITRDTMTLYTEHHVLMLEKCDITCDDFEASLCDYADGDLPSSLKARIEDHADKCECCHELKQSYMLTVKLAALLRDEKPVSNDIQARLREKLNKSLGINLKAASVEEALN